MLTFDLDHIALAATDTSDALRFLTGELGGRVIFGGQAIGFRPMQVWLGTDDGDGMPIELLEPWEVDRNDFLARFVARHGDGPHHLTFKVSDFDRALARVRAAGFHPVNIDVSDPDWKEAFLLPREAHGTVVQLAESNGHPETRPELLAHVAQHGPNMHPRWWVDPLPARGPRALLRRVVLRTPSLAAAVGFFAGVLQGDIEQESETRVDLVWPGGARIGLAVDTEAPPGVDRLEIEGLGAARTIIGAQLVPLAATTRS
jgi:catechol 2,3-dioxygenase-like lactoylglutathione lyase family enzyme